MIEQVRETVRSANDFASRHQHLIAFLGVMVGLAALIFSASQWVFGDESSDLGVNPTPGSIPSEFGPDLDFDETDLQLLANESCSLMQEVFELRDDSTLSFVKGNGPCRYVWGRYPNYQLTASWGPAPKCAIDDRAGGVYVDTNGAVRYELVDSNRRPTIVHRVCVGNQAVQVTGHPIRAAELSPALITDIGGIASTAAMIVL